MRRALPVLVLAAAAACGSVTPYGGARDGGASGAGGAPADAAPGSGGASLDAGGAGGAVSGSGGAASGSGGAVGTGGASAGSGGGGGSCIDTNAPGLAFGRPCPIDAAVPRCHDQCVLFDRQFVGCVDRSAVDAAPRQCVTDCDDPAYNCRGGGGR